MPSAVAGGVGGTMKAGNGRGARSGQSGEPWSTGKAKDG